MLGLYDTKKLQVNLKSDFSQNIYTTVYQSTDSYWCNQIHVNTIQKDSLHQFKSKIDLKTKKKMKFKNKQVLLK
jgi:hypothetical protein